MVSQQLPSAVGNLAQLKPVRGAVCGAQGAQLLELITDMMEIVHSLTWQDLPQVSLYMHVF